MSPVKRLTKKSRTYVLQRAKGIPVKHANSITTATAKVVNKQWNEDNEFKRMQAARVAIKQFWQNAMEQASADDAKWSDKLRASEMLARHLGMFEDETKKGDVFNTVIIDAKHTDESALLERLALIKKQREAIDVDSSPHVAPSQDAPQGI